MRPERSISRWWRLKSLLTVLTVLSPLLQPCLACQIPGICQISCCTAQPSCQRAERITCSCPNIREMDLKAGDIPASAKSISISQLTSLTIEKDALYELHSLKRFSLLDIGNVVVEKGGLYLRANTSLTSFKAIGVNFLYINGHAFSGEWRDSASILFEDIETLAIGSRAFNYTTAWSGPQITIQNVTTLDVASRAFDASIRRLELDAVSMQECHMGTFSEKIFALVFTHVAIPEVQTGCVHSVGRLGIGLGRGIFISSSSLGTVDRQGFSGDIQTLEIKQNTEIDTVREQGFQASVKDFSMIQSKIGTLNSRGINISATHKLSLSRVNVNYLHMDAFMGVRIVPAHRGSSAVNLDRLEVEHAEAGSLALPPCLLLDVSKLHIQAAYSERCPTEKWTRRLLGADEHRALHSAEFKMFLSLSELDHPCDRNEETFPNMVDDDLCSISHEDEKPENENEENRSVKNDGKLEEDSEKQGERESRRQVKRDPDNESDEDDLDETEAKATEQPDRTGQPGDITTGRPKDVSKGTEPNPGGRASTNLTTRQPDLQERIPEDEPDRTESDQDGLVSAWWRIFAMVLMVLLVAVVVALLCRGHMWLKKRETKEFSIDEQGPYEGKPCLLQKPNKEVIVEVSGEA